MTFADLLADGVLIMSDGYRTKRSEQGRPGYRIIRVADVRDGTVTFDSGDFVSDKYQRAIGTKVGRAGDILLTTKGTVGRVAIMPDLDEPVVYSPQLCFFRVEDPNRIDPEYLRYWFGSTEFLNQAANVMNNTDMAAYINLADLKSVRIELPDILKQRAIAAVLTVLDDKVAADTRLCLLADAYIDARLDSACAGSRTIFLGEVAEFHNRRRVPLSSRARVSMPGRIPYYGAACRVAFVNQALFDEKLLLVGEDGSVVTDNGSPVVQYIWGPSWVNNHAHVLTGVGLSTELLYFLVKRANIRPLVTGAVQPKVSMGNLKRLPLELPSSTLVPQIEEIVAAQMAVRRSLCDEARTLRELRDMLLPSLMSGRLRVNDAEAAADAVL